MSKDDFDSLSSKAEAAFRQAAAKVIQRAKQTGTSVVVWEDGQVKETSPDQLETAAVSDRPRQSIGHTETKTGKDGNRTG